MFEHTSRYYGQKTLRFERPDGRVVSYVSRRILPPRESFTTLVEVRLTEGKRLDSIAAATLGAPELFWQICDANDALNPFDLAARAGQVVKVPMPGRQLP
jgi:hypothetical protein